MTERFSRREGLRVPNGNPIWNEAPHGLREGLVAILRDYLQLPFPFADMAIARACARSLVGFSLVWDGLRQRLLQCEAFEVYDACQLVYEDLTQNFTYANKAARYEIELNRLLDHQNVGWRMRSGKLERPLSPAVDDQVGKAFAALGGERFAGPREQWQKAINLLSQRPEPDIENCIKDAVGAVEAVAQIISGMDKQTLRTIVDREPIKSIIPQYLRAVILNVYNHRGTEPGVAHGQTVPSSASVEDGEFVLGLCACIITYMLTKLPLAMMWNALGLAIKKVEDGT